jgi:hypothetical protein
MSQNRSSAVMAQRHEPGDSLDDFPTPPWATRALCEWLCDRGGPPWSLYGVTVWEPACGKGHMSRPLAEYFGPVRSSDVHEYGFGEVDDFLRPRAGDGFQPDWIVTNPPFRLAEQFARRALALSRRGVALLVRTAFLEGARRHSELFRVFAPSEVLQFVERVPMFKGRLDRRCSSATAYCWAVWRVGRPPQTRLHWLAPCRKRLERDEDYAADPSSQRQALACRRLRPPLGEAPLPLAPARGEGAPGASPSPGGP